MGGTQSSQDWTEARGHVKGHTGRHHARSPPHAPAGWAGVWLPGPSRPSHALPPQPRYTVTFMGREKSHLGGIGKGTVGESRDEGSPHLGLAHRPRTPINHPPRCQIQHAGRGRHGMGCRGQEGRRAGLFALLLLRAETIKILIPETMSLLAGGERVARKHRPCSPPSTSDKTSFYSLERST